MRRSYHAGSLLHFEKPVTITSGFRTASWNAKQKNCRWYGIVHNLSDAPNTLQ
uniref:Peptidase n=1 Tax=Myoviridae sp. ctSGr1 TaxID=2827609 RepID=A0A8S5LRT8_9CAUD|nr:MAG TPA: peptidase [Myoviridae sp. ctSGr1]